MARSRPRLRAIVWSLLTLIAVTGTAVVGWWQLRADSAAEIAVSTPAPEPQFVEAGRDFYLHVRLIELKPRKAGDKSWDSGNGSAPDINYKLFWNEHQLFHSTTRDDRLIAEWDLFRVDIKDLLTSAQVDLASAINAPLIHIDGSSFRIEVWDDDPMNSDKALDLQIDPRTLVPGLNTIRPEVGDVVRIELQLIDRSTSVTDLISIANNR